MAPKGLKSFQGMALAQELLAELEKNLASHQGSRSLALALSGTPPPAASSKAPVPGKQATMARQWASLGVAMELRQNTSGRRMGESRGGLFGSSPRLLYSTRRVSGVLGIERPKL